MAFLTRFQKIARVSLGGRGLSYYQAIVDKTEDKSDVKPCWNSNISALHKWDSNWDYREKVKPAARAVRNLFLINTAAVKDYHLTDKGRKQADLAGKRLASFNYKWDKVISATEPWVKETSSIILQHLDKDIEVKDCPLLYTGLPIHPEPRNIGELRLKEYFQDGARFEAGFRKYFYRAPPEQTQDSNTLLVSQTNIMRFFICRALQLPPEGWIRLVIHYGSITWISIHPNGNVILRSMSDTGFLEA